MTRKNEALLVQFSQVPTERLHRIPGMDPRRRHTLPAGAALVREILKALDISRITTSDRSLRDGLIADWVCGIAPSWSSPHVPDPRRRSVLMAMKRFGVDEKHASWSPESPSGCSTIPLPCTSSRGRS